MDLEKLESPEYSQYEYEWTNNRKAYNRLRKEKLEATGEIRCSWCKYNRGENSTREWYGQYTNYKGNSRAKFPSWKLSTKNKKQWMPKGIDYKIVERDSRFVDYTIQFKRNNKWNGH
jgi:hypothetical protein